MGGGTERTIGITKAELFLKLN
jgi:hypothetical protein